MRDYTHCFHIHCEPPTTCPDNRKDDAFLCLRPLPYPGRAIYTAPSASLAALKVIVHFTSGDLPDE